MITDTRIWNFFFGIIATIFFFYSCADSTGGPFPTKNDYNFFIFSDMGATGEFTSDLVSHTASVLGDTLHPRFIISSGDTFHDNGVRDTSDLFWKVRFENVFKGKSLRVDWLPTLGNHEYLGNPQALVDYSLKEGRWKMPSRYYTLVKHIDSKTSLRIVILDTSPFIQKYRKKEIYKEVLSQNPQKQVLWLDSVLASSHETWKIVVGHHPIYTTDLGHGDTDELINDIVPLIRKYNIDFYFSGHVHSFQHLNREGVDYIVTTSACKKRLATPWFFTKYYATSLGFTLCSISNRGFRVSFINEQGKEIYSYIKTH